MGLIYATIGLPGFGDNASITNTHLTPYFLEETQNTIQIPNVVTAILASFRGFDTLGEAFVVFTAAMSGLLLLQGTEPKKKRRTKKA